MKNLYFLAFFTLISCNDINDYTLVVRYNDSDLDGNLLEEISEEEINFTSLNDTIAYIEASRRYMVNEKINEGSPFPKKYLSFKLYNELREDISDIDFATKEQQLEKLKNDVSKIKSYSDNSKTEINIEIDSAKVEKLKPNFKEKTDKFDSRGITWVQHVNTPKYRNQNGFYCYFAKKDGKVENFRFVWQYYADNWLFIEKIVFLVDGDPIDYFPLKRNSDNDSKIWEWGDEQVVDSDKVLIESIANAKSVEVRFIGKQYHNDRKMSTQTIQSIKETLEYYKALGGEF